MSLSIFTKFLPSCFKADILEDYEDSSESAEEKAREIFAQKLGNPITKDSKKIYSFRDRMPCNDESKDMQKVYTDNFNSEESK